MPRVIAYFDMDYTVLDTSSSLLYVSHLRRSGQITRGLLVRVAWWSLLYKLTLIDMTRAMPKMLTYAQGQSASRTLQDAYAWFDDMVKEHISPRAVEKLRWHQVQGHQVVLISASTQFAVQPVAEHLQLDFLCTWLLVTGDRLTGTVKLPPCYAAGKVFWAAQYAAEHDAQLGDAYFYTDSLSDLPLLEAVHHPIVVNPDPRLKRLAHKRGWPIESFY